MAKRQTTHTMNWKQFRELTKDIPDDETVFFEVDTCHGYFGAIVDEEETRANMANDNTIILIEAN